MHEKEGEALARRSPHPIVVSIAGAGPRGKIRALLAAHGHVEGADFVCTA